MTATSLVAYLVLFAGVGFAFVFASLLLGRFLRPNVPSDEKGRPYECGEPAVGSAWLQFDLRFYVVALVFLIFDVEAAFFFPWATVYGKATQMMGLAQAVETKSISTEQATAALQQKYAELGVPAAALPASTAPDLGQHAEDARQLALFAMVDMGVFFAVLLVGFAYVWFRGDLDWVRAVRAQAAQPPAAVAVEPSR